LARHRGSVAAALADACRRYVSFTRPAFRFAAAAFAVAALCALATAPVRAATEEFSTFDVVRQEEDDESMLDHYLTRSPRAWRDEWERAPQAIRTSQGCLTSGQWFIDTDMKVRSSLGRRARFGLDLRQSESDAATYDYLDFTFQFPTRYGTPGVLFRPLYDKSRQDVAVTWETGADTSALQLRVVFTMEDLFNNLWSFRQTRVGNESEPYTRHPYEPGVYFVTRHSHWRAELGGRYLTPSVKRLATFGGEVLRVSTLWGTLGFASVEAEAFGFGLELSGRNQQARSTDASVTDFQGHGRDFRRRWSAESAVRRTILPGLAAEARWIYQYRDASLGPPAGLAYFRGIDRLVALETTYDFTRRFAVRVGGLHDRITIDRMGVLPPSYGTRTESRAYVGLVARFGRVIVSGIEGIELDPEPYELWFVHDKGFLHLQATF
jgi:hypothetical protein